MSEKVGSFGGLDVVLIGFHDHTGPIIRMLHSCVQRECRDPLGSLEGLGYVQVSGDDVYVRM